MSNPRKRQKRHIDPRQCQQTKMYIREDVGACCHGKCLRASTLNGSKQSDQEWAAAELRGESMQQEATRSQRDACEWEWGGVSG